MGIEERVVRGAHRLRSPPRKRRIRPIRAVPPDSRRQAADNRDLTLGRLRCPRFSLQGPVWRIALRCGILRDDKRAPSPNRTVSRHAVDSAIRSSGPSSCRGDLGATDLRAADASFLSSRDCRRAAGGLLRHACLHGRGASAARCRRAPPAPGRSLSFQEQHCAYRDRRHDHTEHPQHASPCVDARRRRGARADRGAAT